MRCLTGGVSRAASSSRRRGPLFFFCRTGSGAGDGSGCAGRRLKLARASRCARGLDSLDHPQASPVAALACARALIPAEVALARVPLRTDHSAAAPRSGCARRTAALARLVASASRSRASAIVSLGALAHPFKQRVIGWRHTPHGRNAASLHCEATVANPKRRPASSPACRMPAETARTRSRSRSGETPRSRREREREHKASAARPLRSIRSRRPPPVTRARCLSRRKRRVGFASAFALGNSFDQHVIGCGAVLRTRALPQQCRAPVPPLAQTGWRALRAAPDRLSVALARVRHRRHSRSTRPPMLPTTARQPPPCTKRPDRNPTARSQRGCRRSCGAACIPSGFASRSSRRCAAVGVTRYRYRDALRLPCGNGP